MISEIMFHPYNAAHPLAEDIREEYFELYNSGDRPVHLVGWRVTRGVEFTFPDVTIQPKAYLAVAADVAVFQARYPLVTNVVGGWIGHLSNSGETIEVVNTLGRVIDSVPYSDEGDWSSRFLGPVEVFNAELARMGMVGSDRRAGTFAGVEESRDAQRIRPELGGQPGRGRNARPAQLRYGGQYRPDNSEC